MGDKNTVRDVYLHSANKLYLQPAKEISRRKLSKQNTFRLDSWLDSQQQQKEGKVFKVCE
jgi:hypothetical protein